MEFDSKESALEYGISYAGYTKSPKREKIIQLLPEPVQSKLEKPHNKCIETYELINSLGKRIEIGIGELGDCFDVWVFFNGNPCKRL